MQDATPQTATNAAAAAQNLPLRRRVELWMQQAWRPAGTAIAVALILVFGWGVVNGRHGLSSWQKQRTQEKELRKQIQEIEDENSRLRNHVDRLKSDPDTIEQEARKQFFDNPFLGLGQAKKTNLELRLSLRHQTKLALFPDPSRGFFSSLITFPHIQARQQRPLQALLGQGFF